MYKYTVKKSITRRAQYYYFDDRHPKYDWVVNNIKPLVPGWTYSHHAAIADIARFTFFSPIKLREVPINGYLFPLSLFDEEVV